MNGEQPVAPNALERAIVAHLQRDGRAPFRALALALGVTETTIYRHAQALMDAGYFRVLGVVDPLRGGAGHAVLAGINCDPTEARRVAAALTALLEVRFAAVVTGTYDVVCELVTRDRAQLTRLLVESLPAIHGVRTINTSWVLHNYITSFLWDMPAAQGSDVPERGEPVLQDEVLSEDEQEAGGVLNGSLLDATDERIAALLQENGRASYAEIAAMLDLTESTARRRTLRLLHSGHVRVVAISNPFMLGFRDVVLLWLKVELKTISAVARALSQQQPVRYLSRTAGGVDLVAEALFHDHAELYAFLDGPLAAIAGIREVSISFELSLFKRAYRRFDMNGDA